MACPQQFPLARYSAGKAPGRVPVSIRRTTSIDSDWINGPGNPMLMSGLARDLFTPEAGPPTELAAAHFRLTVAPDRRIVDAGTQPAHPRMSELVRVRAGNESRAALSQSLGDLTGTPLYQLLDDFAGASLVAPFVWSLWKVEDWDILAWHRSRSVRQTRMENVCTGLAEGATSLTEAGIVAAGEASSVAVGSVENPDDPSGWHAMPEQRGQQTRRVRRMDIWREGMAIKVDAGFQDSGCTPEGGRVAIHEYRVYAEIDAESGILVALQALPQILPFRECPGAALKATRMIGQPVAEFRTAVIETLPSVLGCTHLNDILRAMADVPALAAMLPQEEDPS